MLLSNTNGLFEAIFCYSVTSGGLLTRKHESAKKGEDRMNKTNRMATGLKIKDYATTERRDEDRAGTADECGMHAIWKLKHRLWNGRA